MKATLSFQLPEDQDDFTLATNAAKYFGALWDFQNYLREKVKYQNNPQTDWEKVQDMFFKILEDSDVNLYNIA